MSLALCRYPYLSTWQDSEIGCLRATHLPNSLEICQLHIIHVYNEGSISSNAHRLNMADPVWTRI